MARERATRTVGSRDVRMLILIAAFWLWGSLCFVLGAWWSAVHDHEQEGYAAGFQEGHGWGRLTGFLEGALDDDEKKDDDA